MGYGQSGKSAFDWDIYKSRKIALQHLRKSNILVDTVLQTEDGSAFELVHSQVVSAFGDKITDFMKQNGTQIDAYDGVQDPRQRNLLLNWTRWRDKLKLVKLPRVNKYTLNILVECAYTGYIRTDLPSGGIWQVLDVADHYGMTEVIRACCAFLIKNLNRSNCVYFYHIGIRHRHPLQRCAWHKIRANFKFILAQNELFSNAITGNQAQNDEEFEQRRNNLATIKFEHFEPLLMHDKLNVDSEESVWFAIKHWCNYNLPERARRIGNLLPCMRFPRFRRGTEFSANYIWRDSLVMNNQEAQHQLAVLDRNHRDILTSSGNGLLRDGFALPCGANPRQLRPRVPHSILFAIGGWQQGQPTTLIESYDLNCNLWFESSKKIMFPLAYHGIEYVNGLLYVCGGTDGSEILNELFTFDPVSGECRQMASMRESRCYVSTACLENYLYAMGGHNGMQRMKSVERFDITNEFWSSVADMNVARSDASACVHDSRIYIAGGLNDQVIESSVEFYNQRDNTWTFISSMLNPRTSFTLVPYRDSLMAIGGNNGNERLASVEQFNFATRTWSQHSEMRHRRSTFSAALVEESKLIVVGGYNGHTPFNQVEMYDEQQRSWVILHKIRYDRSGLKVVVVSDLPNAIEYTFLGSVGASLAQANQIV